MRDGDVPVGEIAGNEARFHCGPIAIGRRESDANKTKQNKITPRLGGDPNTSRFWQPYPVDDTYYPPVRYFMTHVHQFSGCGKREVHKNWKIENWSMVKPEKTAPDTRTTLRNNGPMPGDSRR